MNTQTQLREPKVSQKLLTRASGNREDDPRRPKLMQRKMLRYRVPKSLSGIWPVHERDFARDIWPFQLAAERLATPLALVFLPLEELVTVFDLSVLSKGWWDSIDG